jgi:hypothetical protein
VGGNTTNYACLAFFFFFPLSDATFVLLKRRLGIRSFVYFVRHGNYTQPQESSEL